MAGDTQRTVSRAQQTAERLLEGTGIAINGSNPWDIQVHDERLYGRAFREGSLGLGEAYMDGWWDCERIDEMVTRLLRAGLGDRAESVWVRMLYAFQATFTNLQSRTRAYIVGEKHYDLGNDLFQKMLDETMCYSCAYWKEADTLHDAQLAKLDLIARKLELKPGMKVLDIGCGWGSFAEFAARQYGCHVTGITISKEQAQLARERCQGLPVEIILEDYRELTGTFDRIVSIGMFEHVGHKNYSTYFKTAKRLLAKDGLFLLHTIGTNTSHLGADPWINKYIFPNGILPSVAQLIKPTEHLFVMEDWQNLGPDYDRTLMAWHERFEEAWPSLSDRYNERTYRMFRYYLLICAATFRARSTQLWQVVFSHDRPARYDTTR
ncbi:cyclopropane fatty acyl phospholipid synthase [Zymobacter palmae]|uniref:Cyclopropane fatty acid synthase n=1 Tax=Zymobacter palmae TaxID=33074 RepID=A0A348HE56_9GAMM|nr:cyclopropane fatty acyl phospholipid synthase [Zymobacter palmae]BBG29908.1 cyclopropane fatty acid synthase [Zymobacter palmae]